VTGSPVAPKMGTGARECLWATRGDGWRSLSLQLLEGPANAPGDPLGVEEDQHEKKRGKPEAGKDEGDVGRP